MRDVMGCAKFLAGLLILAFKMVIMAEVAGDLFVMRHVQWSGHFKQDWHQDKRKEQGESHGYLCKQADQIELG